MNVQTLIISNRDDISIEYLISKLRSGGVSYLRLNSEDIGNIDFEIVPNKTTNSICRIGSTEYNLHTVQSVLFRRMPVKFNTSPDDPNAAYLNNERKHFLEGLYLLLNNKKWINPMFATQITERKIFQLSVASQYGFDTPKSILTNNAKRAAAFLKSNKESIIKPISNGLQVTKNATFSIYTSPIDSHYFDEADRNTLFNTPVFLQERIPNQADIRVTVVGEKLFAAKIEKKNGSEVDWRKPEIAKKYSPIELPTTIKKSLLDLTQSFGMVYSAIDLIQKPNNDLVFLEINPVGEWVWLEMELGFQISDALLQVLS